MTNFNGLGQLFARILLPYLQNGFQQQIAKQSQQTQQNTTLTNSSGFDTLSVKDNSLLANTQLLLLDNIESQTYLKDIMQLPQEFSKLIELLQQKSSTSNNFVNPETLKEFLSTHAKKAFLQLAENDKDLKAQGAKSNIKFNDLAKIVTNLANSNEQNPAALLKSLILLYLPWVPLDENIDFQLEFGSGGEEEENENSDCITIIIQTIHYGTVKVVICIGLSDENSIDVKIFSAANFPQADLLEDIQTDKDKNFTANISYEPVKLQNSELKEKKQKIDLQTSGNVNPKLIEIAQKLIRAIIDIDKSTELQTHRLNVYNKKNS